MKEEKRFEDSDHRLANAGKTTSSMRLRARNLETTIYPTLNAEPHIGMVKVPDARIDKLTELTSRRRPPLRRLSTLDYIGLPRAIWNRTERSLTSLRMLMPSSRCRGFEDESIIHPLESVNPAQG